MENFVQLISEDERIRVELFGSVFFVRRLDDDTRARLKLEHMKERVATDARDAERQDLAYAAAMFDYILLDWEGVKGPDGKDAPCTKENKRVLPSVAKRLLLDRAVEVHAKDARQEKKDTENLDDSPVSKEPTA